MTRSPVKTGGGSHYVDPPPVSQHIARARDVWRDGMEQPPAAWAEGLKLCGVYYEGFVTDLEGTLEKHRVDTPLSQFANHAKLLQDSIIQTQKKRTR